MKKKSSWYYIFVIIIVLICAFPIYGNLIDQGYELKGVSSVEEKIPVDFLSIWSGKTQNQLENRLKEKVPGRTTSIRLHSQLMYTFFNSSSNANVVIGSKHSLFEPEYLCDFLNLWPLMSEATQEELIEKLNLLQLLLNKNEKKLYILITPSKVRYDYSNIPWFYRALTKPKLQTNYDGFIRRLKATSIDYFDSIEFINENIQDNTIFYSSGIHWGNAAAAQVTVAMLKDMKMDTGYELGNLSINLSDSENGSAPDQDLLSILNLYFYTNEDKYKVPEFTYSSGKDHPNVLMRGGSFMGQSLSKLIDLGMFERSIYFQNNFVICDRTDIQTLSDFNAYDEIDIAGMVNRSELVILEVNEEKIWTMSWGFIDELIRTLQNENDSTNIQLLGQKSLPTDINPWGTNIGYIEYKEKEAIVLTTPLETEIRLNNFNKEKTLSFDAEIHEWVRQYSDGCILIVKMNGEENFEREYFIPGGMEETATIHVSIPIKGINQVSISYFNPEGTTQDCDWVVVQNVSITQ